MPFTTAATCFESLRINRPSFGNSSLLTWIVVSLIPMIGTQTKPKFFKTFFICVFDVPLLFVVFSSSTALIYDILAAIATARGAQSFPYSLNPLGLPPLCLIHFILNLALCALICCKVCAKLIS